MKASAAQAQLAAFIEQYGDIDLVLDDPDTGLLLEIALVYRREDREGCEVPPHVAITSSYADDHVWPRETEDVWLKKQRQQ